MVVFFAFGVMTVRRSAENTQDKQCVYIQELLVERANYSLAV